MKKTRLAVHHCGPERLFWYGTQPISIAWAIVLNAITSGLAQPSPATLQLSAPAYSVAEDADAALITVLRMGDTNGVVTVDYATSDRTAKAGADYAAQLGTLQFVAGEIRKTITVAIIDDGLVEGDKLLTVALSNPSGGAALGDPNAAQLKIVDNELRARLLDSSFNPDVSGTSTSSFVLENDGRIFSTATLSSSDGNPATAKVVRLSANGSLDGSFNFAMEQGDIRALVLASTPEGKVLIGGAFKKVGSVARGGIARLNSDGSLDGTFDPGSGPAGVLNEDTDARVEVITMQPDGKAIIGGVFSRFSGQAHAGPARLNVDGSLDTNFNAAVNVSPGAITLLPDGKLYVGGGFSTVDGVNMGNIARLNADGTLDKGFHSKYIGGGSVIRTAVQPDGKVIIGGSFTKNGTTFSPIARLNPDGSADTNFVGGFIGDPAGHSGVVFTVGLQSDGKIVISGSFSKVGGLPRSNVARLLPTGAVDPGFDFPLDNFPMTVVVQPNDDILIGGNFSVAEGVSRSGIVRVHGHPEGVHPIEFVNAQYSVSEGAGAATLTVQRAGDTTGAANVDYDTSDGTATGGLDYVAQSGTLIFGPLEVTKTITIPILPDALVEGDETVEVHLTHPSNGAQLGEKSTATLTIRDDDTAPQFVADSLSVNENAGMAAVTLRRSGDLEQALTLDYSTSDGTAAAGRDYTPQKGTITFPIGAATQTIRIPILDNGAVDGPRTIQVTVNNAAIYPQPSTAIVTIVDNEQPVLFDPSFATGQGAFGAGDDPCVLALLLQPDGKIVIGGCFTNVGGLSRGGIARLNGDGSVDASFDPGSGVSGPSGSYSSTVSALALQSDGRIILGGSFFNVAGRILPRLARLNPDGTVDETFNARVDALGRGYPDVRQVLVQPSGSILFLGYFSDALGVARLNPDGSVDATFASQPALPAPPIYQLTIGSLADGKILAAGTASNDQRPFFVRLNVDGSLDTAFTAALPATLSAGVNFSTVAPQHDGKILASASFVQADGQSRTAIFQLNSDGSADPTFHAEPTSDTSAQQILVLADGKVLAVGYPGMVRLNADGSLDRSFALGVQAVAIQPDGLMIAGGTFEGGVIRVFPDTDQPGGAAFVLETVNVAETVGTVELELQRLGDTSREMTVDFTTSDVTARAGFDYVAQKGTVRFAPLQVTNTIAIAIINDSLVDGDKSFQVALSNPSSGSTLQRFHTATVVITSNDTGIQFASDTFTVNEAAGFAEVLVTRVGDGLGPAAVDYSTSDGTAKAGADYLARSGTITFASGQTNQTIQIPILDDGIVEGDETIQLALANPKAGAMLGARTNATLVIIDNEIPTLVDPSFDPGKGAINSGQRGEVDAIAVLPDGKILVGGYFSQFNGVARSTLARLNPDGTVDAGFRATFPNGLSQILVQPDSKVLFFYYLNSGTSVRNLSRLAADGTPDPSFRATRFESTPQIGGNFAVALQPDGRILVAGRFDSVGGIAQRNLVRLNADGTLDTTFKTDVGTSTLVNGNTPTVVVQPDGKILISGNFNTVNGIPVNGSARLNANGSLDADFSVYGSPGSTLFLAAQPDGKVLVQQSGMTRLNANGSIDASFNAPNAYVSDTQMAGYPLALQADGKILFIGSVTENDLSQSGLVRLNPDGMLDTTLMVPAIRNDQNYIIPPTAFALQGDGNILVAGDFTSMNGVPRAGLVRVFGNLDGPPDISFATANATASENSGLAIITIQRTGDTSRPASVHYTTQDGTALVNLNYVPTSGTLDFAPLENKKAIVVPLLDSGLPSADRSFSISLSDPSTGTILDAGANRTALTIANSWRPGSIDSTFQALIETTNNPPSGFHIALQPDGKMIVGGDFQRVDGVTRNGICRLNPDGSLDTNFGPDGGLALVPDGFSNSTPIYSVALQADGKILVRGSFGSVNGLTNYANFVRLNTDGSVDTHFLPDAAAQVRSSYDRGGGMAVQPDGKILVAEEGSSTCCGYKPVELGRLTPEGSSDPSFVTLEVVGASSSWGSTFDVIVVEGDGRTLFEGSAGPAAPNSGDPQQGLTRLNVDGSIDASFHPMMDYLVEVDFGSKAAVVVQPDGKIFLAGLFSQVNGVDRPGLARLNPDGSTDASFVPESNDASDRYSRPLALQEDGKLLASLGRSIVRLNADGSRDLSFDVGLDGLKQNGFTASLSDIVVQPDGQILVSGDFTSVNGTARSGLVRLNGDAGLADSRAHFRSITGASTGKVQLALDVIPSRTYAIEASTDLINWTAITTFKATSYWLNLSDPAAPISHRFYRAVQTAP